MSYFTNPPALSAETALRIEQAMQDVGAVQAAPECLNAALNGGGICPASAHNLITMLNQRLNDVALTLIHVNDEIQSGGGR